MTVYHGLCSGTKKDDTPCGQILVRENGRCRLHGGAKPKNVADWIPAAQKDHARLLDQIKAFQESVRRRARRFHRNARKSA